MSNKELLDIDPKEYEGETDTVYYSYRINGYTNVPVDILDTDDDELVTEWIAKWIDDVEDLEIISY